MAEEPDRRGSRAGVIVGLATFLVTLGTFGLTFQIGYTSNAGFAAWVDSVVASVSPWIARVGWLSVNFAVSALAALAASWVTHLVGKSNWPDRWGKWRREKRVSVGTQETMAPAGGQGEEATQADDCRAKVRDLSRVEAQVLYSLLGEYVELPGETLDVWVDDPEVLMSPLKDLGRDLLKSACEELVKVEFLAGVEWRERDGGEEMHVVVAHCMAKKSAARRVAGWVDEEMRGQGVW